MKSLIVRKVCAALWLMQANLYLILVKSGYVLRRYYDRLAQDKPLVNVDYYYSEENLGGREYAKYYVQALGAAACLHKISASHEKCPESIKRLLRLSETDHVSIFLLTHDGNRHVRVAIDAHDSPPVTNQAIYDWCDLYFKSNYWASFKYGSKVKPIINGNALLDHLRLRYIASLRTVKKDIDISCIIRIWAGASFDPRHCLRLLNAVNSLPCSKYVLAIFCGFQEDDKSFVNYIDFCRKSGIPYSLQPMDYNQLIEISSRSNIVILRNGVSSCIPWRYLDMLCAGMCVVLDHAPVVSWPMQLKQGEHYLSMNMLPAALQERFPGMNTLSKDDGDDSCRAEMMRYLNNSELLKKIRSSSVKYYQTYCAPYRLGGFIISHAINR